MCSHSSNISLVFVCLCVKCSIEIDFFLSVYLKTFSQNQNQTEDQYDCCIKENDECGMQPAVTVDIQVGEHVAIWSKGAFMPELWNLTFQIRSSS